MAKYGVQAMAEAVYCSTFHKETFAKYIVYVYPNQADCGANILHENKSMTLPLHPFYILMAWAVEQYSNCIRKLGISIISLTFMKQVKEEPF